jgi:N-acetylmuramoyl-L-alanine amidase
MHEALLAGLVLLCACIVPEKRPPPPAPEPATPAPIPAESARAEPAPGSPTESDPAPRLGDAIVIAGEHVPIGAPVVLWTDPGGYSAYGTEPFFGGEPRADAPQGLRYKPGRPIAGRDVPEPTISDLVLGVDQFVLHYDVCGVSRQCFKVLHDLRGLSVHFLLDVDGTLYQTLDLKDTGWHARQANPRSVGVEIANIGAYPPGRASLLDTWYAQDAEGWRLALPERLGDGGVRTQPFVARPARSERVQGPVQGELLEQFDYTPEQYETLVKLAAALCRVFPRLEPDAPRDAQGRVRTDALSPEEFAEFRGILGHDHVTEDKVDPGPALDWEPFLERVRALLEAP